jgi:hypothetical protein
MPWKGAQTSTITGAFFKEDCLFEAGYSGDLISIGKKMSALPDLFVQTAARAQATAKEQPEIRTIGKFFSIYFYFSYFQQ